MRSVFRGLVPGVMAVFAIVMAGCHADSSAPTIEPLPTVGVAVVAVERQQHRAFEEVVGSVQSRKRAEIGPKVSARVERITVVPGTVVSAGDLLVQLDSREIQARLDQAVAALEQAEGDLRRFTELLEEEAVTQAEFDAVQARERIASATRDEAETMLGYTRITAPFDGVITRKLTEVGDLALPGRPLVVLEDPKALRLDADVPEALIDNVDPGAELTVSVPSIEQPIAGRVSEIAPAADPQSRTFRVKIDLPPTDGLRLGQFGRVAVPVAGSAALCVPASAVLTRGQMEIAFVVTNGQAKLRLVKTGKRFGDEVEVLSGVEQGERVVVGGLRMLSDGQPVEVR